MGSNIGSSHGTITLTPGDRVVSISCEQLDAFSDIPLADVGQRSIGIGVIGLGTVDNDFLNHFAGSIFDRHSITADLAVIVGRFIPGNYTFQQRILTDCSRHFCLNIAQSVGNFSEDFNIVFGEIISGNSDRSRDIKYRAFNIFDQTVRTISVANHFALGLNIIITEIVNSSDHQLIIFVYDMFRIKHIRYRVICIKLHFVNSRVIMVINRFKFDSVPVTGKFPLADIQRELIVVDTCQSTASNNGFSTFGNIDLGSCIQSYRLSLSIFIRNSKFDYVMIAVMTVDHLGNRSDRVTSNRHRIGFINLQVVVDISTDITSFRGGMSGIIGQVDSVLTFFTVGIDNDIASGINEGDHITADIIFRINGLIPADITGKRSRSLDISRLSAVNVVVEAFNVFFFKSRRFGIDHESGISHTDILIGKTAENIRGTL